MTVLVQRLASGWWGEAVGRRAVVLFCLFPGSVVFSMVYAEGVALPLAAGCILALQRRRWLLAGVLAGIATALEPEAVVLVLVCGVSAGLELRRRGWRARESLLAPVLSVTGVAAFAIYLWAHAGTPFAYTQAQKYGWDETFDPFAIVHLVRSLASKLSFSHFNNPTINLNLVVGVAGVIVRQKKRRRRVVDVELARRMYQRADAIVVPGLAQAHRGLDRTDAGDIAVVRVGQHEHVAFVGALGHALERAQ